MAGTASCPRRARGVGQAAGGAVVRASKEETGQDVRDIECINFQQFINPAFRKKRHFIFFDFTCKTDSADVILNDEAEGFVWVEPRHALTMELNTYMCRSVDEWLKKRS